MKKILAILLALLIAVTAFSACGKKDKEEEKTDATDPDSIADANFVSFQSGFTTVTVKNEKTALQAVDSVADSLGLSNSAITLKVSNTSKFDGETYYRMQQYYNDVPVSGREVILVADKNGKVVQLSSNMAKIASGTPGEKKDTSGINYDQLLKKAEELLKNDTLSFLEFSCVTQPEMVFFSPDGSTLRSCFEDIISFKDTENRKYAISVLFDCDTYDPVSVDFINDYVAGTSAYGEDRDGTTRYFNAYRESVGNYWMYDPDKDIGVMNANNNTLELIPAIRDSENNYYYYSNGELIDEDGNPCDLNDDETAVVDAQGNTLGTDLEQVIDYYTSPDEDALEISTSATTKWNDKNAVSAMSRVQNAYDFYEDILGRDSFNDKGGAIRVFYNDTMYGDSTNAYSYGLRDMTVLSFGSENTIAFDVAGHEYTHSVIGSIVDLPYRNQPGALNEAYADIFGEIIEDYSDGALDNSNDWQLDVYRNIPDPASDGNPTQYHGTNWAINLSIPEVLSNTPLAILNRYTDNGGVHTNSTVITHAAYLMNIGIDGNASKKIDTELLAKIWYRSMFSLHSDETFKQCAQHVYEAAMRTDGVTADQLACVKEAFAAANLEIPNDIAA